MTRLLIVHHTPSPSVAELLDVAVKGVSEVADIAEADIDMAIEPALSATASDVLAADGYLLLTPTNIGYMSGALKHFFDTIYYPCLGATERRPYALIAHGNNDTSGAIRSVEMIATGLSWQPAAPPVSVIGHPSKEDREAVSEIAGVLLATVLGIV